MSCEEIGARLERSPVTVRNHVQHILRKLGAHSIAEAVARHLLRDGSELARSFTKSQPQ
jgi:DNA-binding CsgD family transcriptional regulator